MKKYDWKNEYNPIRRTAKRLLSGEPLSNGRPLSDLIELDEHARKCLAFEATLTDRQIDMLQELGYLPVITRQYGKECANCPRIHQCRCWPQPHSTDTILRHQL